MAVTPRSMFRADGALLIPKDKSSFMHSIEEAGHLIYTQLQMERLVIFRLISDSELTMITSFLSINVLMISIILNFKKYSFWMLWLFYRV